MILWWYSVRRFLNTFVFTMVALCVLFVIIDLVDHALEQFLDRNVPLSTVFYYYVVYLPDIAKQLIPVSSLLSALFTVGRMATSNEVTAMRAAGQSFLAYLAPFLLISVIISGGQLWFNGWVVPKANTAKLELERLALSQSRSGQLNNLRFRDNSTRNVSIEYYDESKRTARNVVVEEFGSATSPRLVWRIEAPSMKWIENRGWVAERARRRDFGPHGMTITWLDNAPIPFSIRHDQIVRLQLTLAELTFDEVLDYLNTLKAGGRDTRRNEIDYYAAWAFPFANVVVVLIAVPFASVRRKGGIAVNVAAAMILAFGYIAFSEISKAVGTASAFDPVIVGWSANAIFFVFGLGTALLFRR